jgi:hypothetical protein
VVPGAHGDIMAEQCHGQGTVPLHDAWSKCIGAVGMRMLVGTGLGTVAGKKSWAPCNERCAVRLETPWRARGRSVTTSMVGFSTCAIGASH